MTIPAPIPDSDPLPLPTPTPDPVPRPPDEQPITIIDIPPDEPTRRLPLH